MYILRFEKNDTFKINLIFASKNIKKYVKVYLLTMNYL